MSSETVFRIEEQPEYGMVIRCADPEAADRFEDFLTERNYVLFNTKFSSSEVLFFFGQASSLDQLQKILSTFESE